MVFCIYCKRQQRLDQKVERGVASRLDSKQCYDEHTACMCQEHVYYTVTAYSRTDISVLKVKLKDIFLNNTIEYHSLYKNIKQHNCFQHW